MKKIKHLLLGLGVMSIFSSSVFAEKHLVFLDGYLGWEYSMPEYLKNNHNAIENLPFSGRSVVGNSYTSYVMSADPNVNKVTYQRVWNEVGILKDVFKKKKDNFLRINVDFPGDFWNDAAWTRTTKNFANVAKAAKNIGFKGILFDDEVYTSAQHLKAYYMSNFKFPRPQQVIDNPANYAEWQRKGSQDARGPTPWMDYNCTINRKKYVNSENCAYSNPNHTFKEHMEKLASRFKGIMEAMQVQFPDITILVLHGPATAHPKTNIQGHMIKPNSLYQAEEYKGAMFVGFKEGLNNQASLHDLGEFYEYTTDSHFENAYQWRKFDIASEQYNADVDDTYQWKIPANQRASWSDDVDVGFMISDYDHTPTRGGYNTQGLCTPADVESRLTKALARTDDYVIFYPDSSISNCDDDIRWADVSRPVDARWLNMMNRVYDTIHTPLEISAVTVRNIAKTQVRVFWDVSEFATGQVEYGETTAYGHFNKKETSFNYNQHGQFLRGLKPGTTYHYRVISEDARGNKAKSKDHTFTTLGGGGLLESNKAVTGYVARNAIKHYKIHAKAGQKVTARIDNLSADADLRMQIGSKAGIHNFECKSTHGGTTVDSCSVTLDHDADVYVGVFGYRAANYHLNVSITTTDGVELLASGQAVTGSVARGAVKHYKLHAQRGDRVTAIIDRLNADADLRIQINSKSSIHNFECKSVHGGTTSDRCSVKLAHDADVYIGVFGYRAANYRLKVTQ